MATTYDTKCWDLAGQFLADHPAIASPQKQHELACAIQDTIEAFLEWENNDAQV